VERREGRGERERREIQRREKVEREREVVSLLPALQVLTRPRA
jgi:hypothetical protein